MPTSWAETFFACVFIGYIVAAFWYLARPMEDDDEQQQH
jgi:hypothetical protein